MGQFTERYEKLQSWAALPGEPLAPENDTERLDDPPTTPTDLSASGSISISVAVSQPPAETDAETDAETPR
jgi:hypothetical protein